MDPLLSAEKREYKLETDFSQCVFCQVSSKEPMNNSTQRGIGKFIQSVKANEDEEIYKRLSFSVDNNTIVDLLALENKDVLLSKKPKYHISCRNFFTHKRRAAKQPKLENKEQDNESERLKRNKPVNLNINCFLCEKQRDSKGVWKKWPVATVSRQEAIHNKARELQDDHILTKIQGYGENCLDMVAADFRYHESCIKAFNNRKQAAEMPHELMEIEEQGPLTSPYDEAFAILIDEISDSLIKDRAVYYVKQLRDRFRKILSNTNVPNSSLYPSRRIQKRLIRHFGSEIQVVAQKNQSSIICSSSITVGEMFSMIAQLKERLDESTLSPESEDSSSDETASGSKNVTFSNDLYAVAKHVRTDLKDKGRHLKEKRYEEDNVEVTNQLEVSYESASDKIPDSLYNLIAWIICKEDESKITATGRVQLLPSDHERVINISQDIMSLVTKEPLPKQIGLALYILRQTRSKDMVTVLNRFGHSISYKEAQRYITAMAHKVELQTIDYGIFVPFSIKPDVFTQCAFDNLDFHEDTKDGSTLHATSHNIYQYPDGNVDVAKCVIPKKAKSAVVTGSYEQFLPPESNISLKDRRNARSLKGLNLSEIAETDNQCIFKDRTFVWALLRRQYSDENEQAPISWNTFCESTEATIYDKTTIAYGPIFPQSPTNPDVVQASIDYFMTLTQKLNQQSTVVTCDQAIYDIVKGITEKFPAKYKSLVVRLGGFHIIENFLGALGSFMKGSGLEEIFTESDLCLRGTANKILAGKDYYKMIRCHSIMCEALINLIWNAFEDWYTVEFEDQSHLVDLYIDINILQQCLLFSDTGSDEVNRNTELVLHSLDKLLPSWNDFCAQLGATGQFWLMYIVIVLIAKRYVYAERAGHWNDHLKEIKNMLPYIVSAGHTKYMSCLPLYLKDMSKLPETHADVHQEFEEGKFNVRQLPGAFNGVWSDLALEQTYNKEGKSSLFKGISQSNEARNKYVQTVPLMTKVSESVKAMVHLDSEGSMHHGETVIQIKEDYKRVCKIQDLISSNFVDPFQSEINKSDLVNIVTGEKSTSTDLIKVHEKGLNAILAAEASGSDKIIVPKIITFVQKKTKTPPSKSLVQLYQDESSVTRALCFIEGADEKTRYEAFSHEWSSYPPSLFKPDAELKTGFAMIKSNKSEFLTALLLKVGSEVTQPQSLPPSIMATSYLIDAMAFIQRYRTMRAKLFKELVEQYVSKILQNKPQGCTSVNIVGDRYDFSQTESLKGDERERRESKHGPGREYAMTDGLEIPDWMELMSNSNNKANLLSYFSNSICQNAEEMIPKDVIVIIGGCFESRSKAVAVRNGNIVDIDSLSCEEHEEADTRIMAHLAYIANTLGYKRAVISCTDTDIILLAMYHFCLLPLEELWIQRHDTYLPVHDLVKSLTEKCEQAPKDIMDTLLCTYVLSGCDTTSYIFRKGKRKAANIALQLVGSFPNMANFGLAMDGSLEVQEVVIDEARKFFVRLYCKDSFDDLDILRQHIFPSGTDLRLMPPTEDSFRQHVLRCLYQLLVYHRATWNKLQLPSPIEFGRTLLDGRLCPVMITKSPKPPNVKNIACKCAKTRCLRNCSCARARVRCFVGCLCLGSSQKCGRLSVEVPDEEDASDPDSDF